MKESELRTRAKLFAVAVIEMCDSVKPNKGRSVLVNQIVRSATSIGANLHEAHYAASKADFINKLQISLKECFETEYWLDLMMSIKCIPTETGRVLLNECGIIRKMLVKSLNTVKQSKE